MDNIISTWVSIEDKLRGFILGRTHDKDLTEDILQEVFLKIHTKIDTLKDETRLQAWIYQVARNLIVDHFRSMEKDERMRIHLASDEEDISPADSMDEAISDMIGMMDNLPPGHCESLCATEIEGLSIQDYADRAGISYNAAKTRVSRSKQELKSILMQCCHYEFDKYGTVLNIEPNHLCCS